MSASELERWLAAHVAELLDLPPARVDPEAPFSSFGLDSASAAAMAADLENLLGRRIDPMDLYDYPTIRRFVRHLESLGAVRPDPL